MLGMASELDYAFLAEYAKAERGTISAIGASYTEVRVDRFPASHLLCVAGRVRTGVDDPAPELQVTFTPASEEFALRAAGVLPRDQNAVSYANKVGYVFALSVSVELDRAGLYRATVELDGVEVRQLFFTVTH